MTFVVWLFRLIRKNSFRNASSYLLYSGLLLHVCVYNKLAVVTAPKVNLMTYNVGYFPKNLSLQFPSALLPFRYGDSKILLLSFFPFADVQGIPCQIEEAMLLHFGALNSERKIKPKSFLLRLPLPKLGPLPPGITEINRAQTTRKADTSSWREIQKQNQRKRLAFLSSCFLVSLFLAGSLAPTVKKTK